MEDRRRGSETSSGQASEGGQDDEQVDTGENDGERNGVRDQAPVERESGGGLGEVSLPMEDHSHCGEEGGGEHVVDQELQRRFFVRCAVRTLFVHVILFQRYFHHSFLQEDWSRCVGPDAADCGSGPFSGLWTGILSAGEHGCDFSLSNPRSCPCLCLLRALRIEAWHNLAFGHHLPHCPLRLLRCHIWDFIRCLR